MAAPGGQPAPSNGDEPPTVTELAERGKQPQPKPQPKPLVDLEGRHPEEFADSTRGQGAIERLFEIARGLEPAIVARGAFEHERVVMKGRVDALIFWLRRLKKELEML